MKILILSDRIPPENAGGAGRVAWLLAGGLHKRGHDVYVVAATDKPSFREQRNGIPTYHIHSRYPDRLRSWVSLYNPQTVPALRTLLHELRPDIVNAHNVHQDLSWASLSMVHREGIPVVYTSHDLMSVAYTKLTHFIDPHATGIQTEFDYKLPRGFNLRQMRLRYNPFRNPMIRHILMRDVQQRVSVSDTQRWALSANGLMGFDVVYNGIDLSEFDLPEGEVIAYRERLHGRPTILFAGRLSAEKGANVFLSAFEKVREYRPDAQVLLLGTPERAASILQKWPQVIDSVVYGGWLQGRELAAAYLAADLVTMPSIFFESLPMVALEGMAAGKPVIASAYGGLMEVVRDGQTGYLINPFDRDAFANRLLYLIDHPDIAKQMGAQGRKRVESTFTLERQVDAMEAIFRNL